MNQRRTRPCTTSAMRVKVTMTFTVRHSSVWTADRHRNDNTSTHIVLDDILVKTGAGVAQYSVWVQIGRPGFDTRQRQRTFPLVSVSRLHLRPTKPPIQWVSGGRFPGVKRDRGVTLTTYPHLGRGQEWTGPILLSPLELSWRLTGQLYFNSYPDKCCNSPITTQQNLPSGLNVSISQETLAFCGTWRLTIVLTTSRHWYPSCARWIQSGFSDYNCLLFSSVPGMLHALRSKSFIFVKLQTKIRAVRRAMQDPGRSILCRPFPWDLHEKNEKPCKFNSPGARLYVLYLCSVITITLTYFNMLHVAFSLLGRLTIAVHKISRVTTWMHGADSSHPAHSALRTVYSRLFWRNVCQVVEPLVTLG
jgi:hypothetical protein